MKLISKTFVVLTLILFATAARAESWQYAVFAELSGNANYSWEDGERRIASDDYSVFVEKLANAGVIASGAKPKTFMALFDQLGAQGWELVTIHNQAQGGQRLPAVLRYFKRPSRK